jgi:hypothetical protein
MKSTRTLVKRNNISKNCYKMMLLFKIIPVFEVSRK